MSYFNFREFYMGSTLPYPSSSSSSSSSSSCDADCLYCAQDDAPNDDQNDGQNAEEAQEPVTKKANCYVPGQLCSNWNQTLETTPLMKVYAALDNLFSSTMLQDLDADQRAALDERLQTARSLLKLSTRESSESNESSEENASFPSDDFVCDCNDCKTGAHTE